MGSKKSRERKELEMRNKLETQKVIAGKQDDTTVKNIEKHMGLIATEDPDVFLVNPDLSEFMSDVGLFDTSSDESVAGAVAGSVSSLDLDTISYEGITKFVMKKQKQAEEAGDAAAAQLLQEEAEAVIRFRERFEPVIVD